MILLGGEGPEGIGVLSPREVGVREQRGGGGVKRRGSSFAPANFANAVILGLRSLGVDGQVVLVLLHGEEATREDGEGLAHEGVVLEDGQGIGIVDPLELVLAGEGPEEVEQVLRVHCRGQVVDVQGRRGVGRWAKIDQLVGRRRRLLLEELGNDSREEGGRRTGVATASEDDVASGVHTDGLRVHVVGFGHFVNDLALNAVGGRELELLSGGSQELIELAFRLGHELGRCLGQVDQQIRERHSLRSNSQCLRQLLVPLLLLALFVAQQLTRFRCCSWACRRRG